MKAYCGRLGAPSAGVAALITAGKQSFGGYAVSGGPQGALTNGTFDGTQVDTQGGGARLQGTVTSNTFTGNLTTQGGASAPVTAAEGACATLASELLDGGASDGGDGGSDGGGDAGAPPTPETVFTAPAPGVGYMAISGATLFYTVAYPYFQEKIEIRAVGTDGMGDRLVAQITSGAPAAGGLLAIGGNVFVSGGVQNPVAARLLSVPGSGGDLVDLGPIGRGVFEPNSGYFKTDGTNIYRGDCYLSLPATGIVGAFSTAGASLGSVNASNVCAVAVDGTDVFYNDVSGVYRTPKALSSAGATVLVAEDYRIAAGSNGIGQVQNLLTDATNLYTLSSSAGGGAVFRRAKDGSGAVSMVATAVPKRIQGAATLTDTHLYFFGVTVNGGQGGGGTVDLMRAPKGATGATAERIESANSAALVQDATYVYYGAGDKIRRVRR